MDVTEYIKENEQTLGLYLFLRRQKLKLTQRELAEKTGIHRSMISAIEVGLTTNPKYDTLLRMAYALKLDLDFVPRENKDES